MSKDHCDVTSPHLYTTLQPFKPFTDFFVHVALGRVKDSNILALIDERTHSQVVAWAYTEWAKKVIPLVQCNII